MRLRQRKNVDLPQPLGPMMAVLERARDLHADPVDGLFRAVEDRHVARIERRQAGGFGGGPARAFARGALVTVGGCVGVPETEVDIDRLGVRSGPVGSGRRGDDGGFPRGALAGQEA